MSVSDKIVYMQEYGSGMFFITKNDYENEFLIFWSDMYGYAYNIGSNKCLDEAKEITKKDFESYFLPNLSNYILVGDD